MKKIILILFCISLASTMFAQKVSPTIKEGTKLYCNAYVSGQEVPLILTIEKAASPFTFGWAVDGYGEGKFEISDKALENGNKINSPTQPALGVTKLGDDETFAIISKVAYKSLIDNKSFTYNGVKFKSKVAANSTMKINDKEIETLHVASEDGKIELWILTNASFPLIMQSVGLLTDIVVIEIN